MRPSPLKHTLAVLRQAIGLTQKEMAELIGRSARTIQAIELGTLPLSDELAIRISDATGVDLGWLAAGNPQAPPRRGQYYFYLAKGKLAKSYSRADYEFHRAFVEAPVAASKELAANAKTSGKVANDPKTKLSIVKAADAEIKGYFMRQSDAKLMDAVSHLLESTAGRNSRFLIRWKIARLLGELAHEESITWPQDILESTCPIDPELLAQSEEPS